MDSVYVSRGRAILEGADEERWPEAWRLGEGEGEGGRQPMTSAAR